MRQIKSYIAHKKGAKKMLICCCFYGIEHHLDTVEVNGSILKKNHLSRYFAFVQPIKAFVDILKLDH